MFRRRRGDDLAAGGNNIGREEVVAGHPQVPAAHSPAATKRQPGDPYGWAAPTREVDVMQLEPLADICVTRAASNRHRAYGWIDADRTHPFDVGDQSVGGGKSGVGMPTRADGEWSPSFAGPRDAGRRIFR